MTAQVFLTEKNGTKRKASVQQVARWQFRVSEIQGCPVLADHTLSFHATPNGGAVSHDMQSDSYSRFGSSEHIEVPGVLLFKDGCFFVKHTVALQSGLDALQACVACSR